MADEQLYWQSLIDENTRTLIDLYLNDERDKEEREDDIGQATVGLITASLQFLKYKLTPGTLDFSDADVRVELAFEVGMQFGQTLQQAIATEAAAQAQRLGSGAYCDWFHGSQMTTKAARNGLGRGAFKTGGRRSQYSRRRGV